MCVWIHCLETIYLPRELTFIYAIMLIFMLCNLFTVKYSKTNSSRMFFFSLILFENGKEWRFKIPFVKNMPTLIYLKIKILSSFVIRKASCEDLLEVLCDFCSTWLPSNCKSVILNAQYLVWKSLKITGKSYILFFEMASNFKRVE